MAIKLGDRVTDKISGVTGTVVATAEFLDGAPRVGIQPHVVASTDGKAQDVFWTETARVEPYTSNANPTDATP